LEKHQTPNLKKIQTFSQSKSSSIHQAIIKQTGGLEPGWLLFLLYGMRQVCYLKCSCTSKYAAHPKNPSPHYNRPNMQSSQNAISVFRDFKYGDEFKVCGNESQQFEEFRGLNASSRIKGKENR